MPSCALLQYSECLRGLWLFLHSDPIIQAHSWTCLLTLPQKKLIHQRHLLLGLCIRAESWHGNLCSPSPMGSREGLRQQSQGSVCLVKAPAEVQSQLHPLTALSQHAITKDMLFLSSALCAGKSSIIRVLGGLWPLAGGHLRRPAAAMDSGSPKHSLFFVPQRPYTTTGTLQEQVGLGTMKN